MNPAAVILGLAGSFVALVAASKREGAVAMDEPAPPPDPLLRALPPPAATPLSIPSLPVSVDSSAPDATPLPATTGRTAKEAARELLSYVSPLIRAGNGDALGTKEAPNQIVLMAQRDMKGKGVVADGVYGPKTAARGKELLGIEFPSRTPAAKRIVSRQPPTAAAAAKPAPSAAPVIVDMPQSAAASPAPAAPLVEIMKAQPPAPPPPPDVPVAKHSPKEAAAALLIYLEGPSPDFGSKGHPSSIVRDAQSAMGKLTADGIYGPKTQARGRALTGKAFPARK